MAPRRHLLPLAFLALSLAMPAAAGVWTPIGPDGGTIRRLLVDPVTPTTLYAASSRGFYKSTDGGVTWNASGSGLPPGHLPYRIALDPTAPSTLYAGIFLPGTAGESLYKSTDGGGSWTLLPPGVPSVRALAVDPTTPGRLYVGCNSSKVFRSTDGGATWASATMPGGIGSIESLDVDPITPGVVYAATFEQGSPNDRLYKSTDGGVSFAPTPLVGKDVITIAVDPVTPSTVYAAAYFSFVTSPIWKSTDGGASWNPMSVGLPPLFSTDTALAVDPVLPSTVYAGGLDGVYRSSDGGGTWALAASGLAAKRIHALAVHPTTTGTLWAGTEGGMARSTNGGTSWTLGSTGIRDDELAGLVVDPTAPAVLYAASTLQGVEKSTDAGAHWSPAIAGLPDVAMGPLLMNPGSTTTLHALASDGLYVVRTLDGGATWDVTTSGLPPDGTAFALAVDPSTPSVLYVGIDGDNVGGPAVFKSTDTGATWSPTAGPLDVTIVALAVASSGRIYAGTGFPPRVYTSDDGGDSWSAGVFVPTGVSALAVDPTDPQVVLAATEADGVYGSTDGGLTWIPAGVLPSNLQVVSLAIDPSAPGRVYAATTQGVYASLDGGADWSDISGGLATRYTNAVALDPIVPGRVYAATLGTGAYRRDVGACSVDFDCDDANLCTTDACLPGDSASDAFGCVHTQPPCAPVGACQTGTGTCNRDTGACTYPSKPNGVACPSDGSGCTLDTCQSGVCTHTADLILSCRTPGVPKASVLTFRNPSPPRAALTWRWRKGDAVLGDFGDPFTPGASDYDLCLFDHGGAGGSPRFLLGISAPAGGTCAGKSCWTSSGTTIKYKDKDRTPNGLATLLLKPGDPGKASFSAVAKGANLTLPTAALVPGVTVQLRRDAPTSVCWQGIYNGGITLNVPGKFRAKSE